MSALYSNKWISTAKVNVNYDIIAPLQYSGTWYVNSGNTLSGPDQTFTPSQFTLDTSVPTINAAMLLNPSTSYFAITAPVTGIYAFVWTTRGSTGPLTTGSTFQTIVYTYVGAHVLNGTSIANLGSQPGVNYRPGMQQMSYTTASGNSTTLSFHQSCTPTIYLKAGDVVAPWIGGGNGNSSGSMDTSLSTNKFSVTLIRQTA
jgi:hypothetical protein